MGPDLQQSQHLCLPPLIDVCLSLMSLPFDVRADFLVSPSVYVPIAYLSTDVSLPISLPFTCRIPDLPLRRGYAGSSVSHHRPPSPSPISSPVSFTFTSRPPISVHLANSSEITLTYPRSPSASLVAKPRPRQPHYLIIVLDRKEKDYVTFFVRFQCHHKTIALSFAVPGNAHIETISFLLICSGNCICIGGVVICALDFVDLDIL